MGFSKIFKAALALAVGSIAFVGLNGEAQAYTNDYCREYTRTVYIGGRAEEAFGRACLQPNGDWMIVDENLGYNDIPHNASRVDYVIRDNNRYVTPQRVVYYNAPVRYYNTRPAAAPAFVWYNGGHYRGNRHVVYQKHPVRHVHKKHDRRYDHRDRRGRGHGRDK